jgi:anhydro-N-acetylmuramic acid kinase
MQKAKTGSKKYLAIGMMSGTSLDGMDLVLCELESGNQGYAYTILQSETFPYSISWQQNLSGETDLTGEELMILHKQYGRLVGENIRQFMGKINIPANVDFIAMHGHTIFYNPVAGLTFQLGDANSVAVITQAQVIADFRSMDMANGGQGAPLVPVGDLFLFDKYPYCLNLGGIVNISIKKDNHQITGFDICGCNLLLDRLAKEAGMAFDNNGHLAKTGNAIQSLLQKLISSRLDTFKAKLSLSKEMILQNEWQILENTTAPINDKLVTVCEYIAEMVNQAVSSGQDKQKMLVTGGGAFNTFLIDKLQEKLALKIILPDKNLIGFKEALIFAFLGLRRLEQKYNCLSSVTGAKRNSTGGCIYLP